MDWLEITVYTAPESVDTLAAHLESLGVDGLVVNDESALRAFLDMNPSAWDFVEDEVFLPMRGKTNIQFYFEDSAEGKKRLDALRQALPSLTFHDRAVRDEDWLNNWRAYFKPTEIGHRLLIVPEWEPIPETDRTILLIEPKNAFGTGAHASTRMCLEELETHEAAHVLDLGCGSGILAVAALLFGAHDAVCADIAPDAATVCADNAELNALDPARLETHTADILSGNTLSTIVAGRRFGIVFANIIADVIIPLAGHVPSLLSPGGVFICSGIIDGRQDEVRKALVAAGLSIINTRTSDGWHMLAASLPR